MKYPPIFDYLYLFIAVFIFCDIVLFKESFSENEILIFFGFMYLYLCSFLEDILEISLIKEINDFKIFFHDNYHTP